MSTPVIAFFNNNGGVGKTSLVYHLAWMFASRGLSVVAADLNPQSNLTAAFLDDDRLEEDLSGVDHPLTIFGCLEPLKKGTGDVSTCPHVETISEHLGLILGDMALSTFEDQLSEVWPKCMDRDERAFRVTSAFWRALQAAASQQAAELILIDLGPNLGAINRAALISSDFVVVPLLPDLFSLQGLWNLGPALRRWREEWQERLAKNPVRELALPPGGIRPIGYMLLRHSIRLWRPVKAFERWIARVPQTYRQAVLLIPGGDSPIIDTDPNCIAALKDYRSLMPLAQEARKPMFFLKAADGALGAHGNAATSAYLDYLYVAREIATRIGITLR